ELNKLLELLKQEQRALFQAAGVNGENEIYKTAENHNKKEEMLQEMNSIKEQLQNLFSESKTEELLASTMNRVQLEKRKEKKKQYLKRLVSTGKMSIIKQLKTIIKRKKCYKR